MVENGADVLRFCDHYLGRSTSTGWHIERIDEAGVARLEKSFTLDTDAWPAPARIPPFAQYDGVVAFHGTCSGQHDRTRLCLRRSGGTFEELATPMPIPSNASVHGLDGEAGPELVAWIPGVDAWTFVLPRQGRVVHFNDEEAQRIDEQVRTATGETLTGRYRTCVLVARAGDVLRYACASQSSASAIELDLGTKSVRAEPYPDADGHGSFGLRFEGGHLLESVDGWRTWHRVAAPEPNLHGPIRCHRMGCEVGDWIRLGWGSAKR